MEVTPQMCAAGRVLGDPRLAPDAGRVAFVASAGGSAALVTVDGAGGPERVITAGVRPRSARTFGGGVYDWLPDGSAFVFVAESGGVHVQPSDGGPTEPVWSPAAGTDIASLALSPDGTRVACVLDEWMVIVVDIRTATVTVVDDTSDFALDPAWSPDGRWLAWTAWDVPAMPWDASRVVLAPADGTGPVRSLAGGAGSAAQQPRFAPDGSSVALLDDRSGWLNLTVVRLDGGAVTSLAEPFEHAGPSWGPGQRSFAWSPDGTSLAVCRNESGFGRLLTWVPGEDPVSIGRGVHGGLSWRGDRLAAMRTGGATPTQVVVYEHGPGSAHAHRQRRSLALGPVGGFPAAEPEVVSWPGEDGAAIPGRLYRPTPLTGSDTDPVPPALLVWVHGGPTDQWQVEFRARFAYWLDRGWAILVPDYRGSTGHGRAFTQALAGRWGELDVADVAAGARAAASRGWGDATRMVAMGSSAGGFTVLNLLATRPGLFAAGVDLYGLVDLVHFETHRFEAHYNDTLIGPLPDTVETYRERSPLARAASIVDPLLVLHGSADPVVPVAQSEALVAALQQLGRPVELHVYEGEGHGWSRPEVVVDELERTEDFLRRRVPAP